MAERDIRRSFFQLNEGGSTTVHDSILVDSNFDMVREGYAVIKPFSDELLSGAPDDANPFEYAGITPERREELMEYHRRLRLQYGKVIPLIRFMQGKGEHADQFVLLQKKIPEDEQKFLLLPSEPLHILPETQLEVRKFAEKWKYNYQHCDSPEIQKDGILPDIISSGNLVIFRDHLYYIDNGGYLPGDSDAYIDSLNIVLLEYHAGISLETMLQDSFHTDFQQFWNTLSTEQQNEAHADRVYLLSLIEHEWHEYAINLPGNLKSDI